MLPNCCSLPWHRMNCFSNTALMLTPSTPRPHLTRLALPQVYLFHVQAVRIGVLLHRHNVSHTDICHAYVHLRGSRWGCCRLLASLGCLALCLGGLLFFLFTLLQTQM